MSIYSLAVETTSTTASTTFWEAFTGSADRALVLELTCVQKATNQSTVDLYRPSALGITPTSPVTVLAEDGVAPAGKTQVAVAWATPPTYGSDLLKTVRAYASSTWGVTWIFPKGLLVPASSSIILVWGGNAVATVTTVVLDE